LNLASAILHDNFLRFIDDLSTNPPQYTNGRGSNISNPDPKLLLSSSISSIDGCLCMIALIVLMGDELFEA
jgi:hypothetical protein